MKLYDGISLDLDSGIAEASLAPGHEHGQSCIQHATFSSTKRVRVSAPANLTVVAFDLYVSVAPSAKG